jgi:predicted molibdopterin-dependent oxidoreductase YjgC
MSNEETLISLSIDNKTYRVNKGITILDAARQNDIYIPTLCFHKELSPHGGCRMCIVEVEGFRNLPTACTTPVADGMIISTRTAGVQASRMEILQLFMSEHPSSCLICDEEEECRKVLSTIRKAGVTTGCRYCPNDQQCELQDVAEYLGVTEINYPIYYRNLRVEREDPFFDRDYNQCILCGRCVRMCQEVRLANVLAFKHRGRETVVGPAFKRTHFEAGCEFCGACVAVCPTGALREKTRSWEGVPDRTELTTCSFCGVGCQVQLLVKGDRVIGSLPAEDPLVSNGRLCVKGRFCITELVDGHQRLKQPNQTIGNTKAEISWDVAIAAAAEKLADCKPDEFGMLVSPNLCNEDFYVAQKFVRAAMGSHNIDTSARAYYGPGFNAYLKLLGMSVPLSEVQKASTVLCIGLDPRFGRSVVGVALRRAIKAGAKVITINPKHHALTLVADKWLQPKSGHEAELVQSLAALTDKKATGAKPASSKAASEKMQVDLAVAAEMLKHGTHPVIMLGSEFLQLDQSLQLLEAVAKLAQNIGAGVLPLPAQNNLVGSILMGVYPELLPGGSSSTKGNKIASANKLKVLYLIGEVPQQGLPRAEFLITQNIYPPEPLYDADLVLPAAAFTERDGTFINGEGRVQRVRKAVEPAGRSLPDWEILCRIAKAMGKSGFDYTSVAEIHKEIAGVVDGFGDFEQPHRQATPLAISGEFVIAFAKTSAVTEPDAKFPFLLNTSIAEHTHRGFALATWVEGSRQLMTEGVLEMNPEDARETGVSPGEEVVVASSRFEATWPVRIHGDQPKGILHVTLHQGESISPNPHPVSIRRKHV